MRFVPGTNEKGMLVFFIAEFPFTVIPYINPGQYNLLYPFL